MKKLVSNGVLVLAGLLGPEPTGSADRPVHCYRNDPRLKQLKDFFSRLQSPAEVYASDFLIAADRHSLDWRLLPSIAIIESGGGKAYRNNNIFGWDSCRRKFVSIQHGIHAVADRLRNSKLYRNKDLDGLLQTYNEDEEYPLRVKSVMRRLGPRHAGQLRSN
jgi:hypothetical protein